MKQLIINAATSEKRLAILKNKQLMELTILQPHQVGEVGGIYAGRIVEVVPGIGAAFVDIGRERPGFIQSHNFAQYTKNPSATPISKLAKQGASIIVQIKKAATGNKGAVLSEKIELPGLYVIYLPNGENISVSRKIEDEATRESWKGFGEEIREANEGFIFRTSCESAAKACVLQEINELRDRYQELLKQEYTQKKPGLLYEQPLFFDKLIDKLTGKSGAHEIVVDQFELYQAIRRFVHERGIHTNVTYYNRKEDIFYFFGIHEYPLKSLQRTIQLANKASIVIDETEACTVIDVNSGGNIGKNYPEESVVKINHQAAVEIIRQLKIRNLSGMILIDFINMKSESNRNKILRLLREESKHDHNKLTIHGFTKLGMVEVTREKEHASLRDTLQMSCPACLGTGKVDSVETICWRLERECWELRSSDYEAILIEATEDVIQTLKGPNNEHLSRLESALGYKLYFNSTNATIPYYAIRKLGTNEEIKQYTVKYERN